MQLFTTILLLLPALSLAAPAERRQTQTVDVAQIQALLNEINSVSTSIQASIAQLDTSFDSVSSSFTGSAAESLAQDRAEWDAATTSLNEALQSAGSALSGVLSTYSDTEQQNTDTWSRA